MIRFNPSEKQRLHIKTVFIFITFVFLLKTEGAYPLSTSFSASLNHTVIESVYSDKPASGYQFVREGRRKQPHSSCTLRLLSITKHAFLRFKTLVSQQIKTGKGWCVDDHGFLAHLLPRNAIDSSSDNDPLPS